MESCLQGQANALLLREWLLTLQGTREQRGLIHWAQKSKEPGLDLPSTDGKARFFFLSWKNFIMMQYSDCFTFI